MNPSSETPSLPKVAIPNADKKPLITSSLAGSVAGGVMTGRVQKDKLPLRLVPVARGSNQSAPMLIRAVKAEHGKLGNGKKVFRICKPENVARAVEDQAQEQKEADNLVEGKNQAQRRMVRMRGSVLRPLDQGCSAVRTPIQDITNQKSMTRPMQSFAAASSSRAPIPGQDFPNQMPVANRNERSSYPQQNRAVPVQDFPDQNQMPATSGNGAVPDPSSMEGFANQMQDPAAQRNGGRCEDFEESMYQALDQNEEAGYPEHGLGDSVFREIVGDLDLSQLTDEGFQEGDFDLPEDRTPDAPNMPHQQQGHHQGQDQHQQQQQQFQQHPQQGQHQQPQQQQYQPQQHQQQSQSPQPQNFPALNHPQIQQSPYAQPYFANYQSQNFPMPPPQQQLYPMQPQQFIPQPPQMIAGYKHLAPRNTEIFAAEGTYHLVVPCNGRKMIIPDPLLLCDAQLYLPMNHQPAVPLPMMSMQMTSPHPHPLPQHQQQHQQSVSPPNQNYYH